MQAITGFGSRRSLFSQRGVRRAIVFAGLTGVLGVAGLGYASMAAAAPPTVSPDDSRATAVTGNFTDHQCLDGLTDLVDSNGSGNNGTYSGSGITVVVSNLAVDTADPFFTGSKSGTAGTLPAGTQVVNITLPAGTTLTGDIYIKGGDGYNVYPGSALTLLIPPINNGGEVAALSHFIVCGGLAPTTGSITVTKHVSGVGPGGTYDVLVDCTPNGPSTTLHLADGQSATVSSIPDGSSCTVTETGANGADTTTYSVNSGAASTTPPTITVNAGDSDTVDVTNTYLPGSLRVTKTVVNNGTAPPGATYPVTVDCPGAPGTPFTFSLGDGDHHDISPLDPGTQCTVTETNSHGGVVTYTVGATTGSTPPTVTITHNNQSEVDITNTFPAAPAAAGTIHVTKALTLPPLSIGNATVFSFTLDCGSGPQTFTVTPGTPVDVPNVPAGVNCTLTETGTQGAQTTTFTVGGVTTNGTSATVTVTNGGTTNVTVTNAYQPAELDVTKDVTGTLPPRGPFSVSVDCPGAPGTPFTFDLTSGATHQITGLPGGVDCTVTETSADGATSTTYTVGAGAPGGTPPTVSLASGDTKSVTITNDFAPAVLQVTKATSGTTPPTGPFAVQVVCTDAGTFTFNINAGQTHTINTDAGDTCTVTETDALGATSTTYTVGAGAPGSTPPTVVLGARGSTTTVGITNNFPLVIAGGPGGGAAPGALTINKIVDGTGTGSSGPFTVTADCGAAGTFTFASLVGGSTETQSIPAGATCTVTETDANGATTVSYQVGGGALSSSPPSVGIASGGTTTVTVTNTFVTAPPPPPVGALHIHKSVDKHTANYGDNLIYTLHVSAGSSDQHDVTVTDVVPVGTVFVSATCPAPCTVSGPSSGGVVTWSVGTLSAGSSIDLTLVVNITTPTTDALRGQPERITNTAVASSTEHPTVPSNTVHTHVGAVQPLNVSRSNHHQVLAATASNLPFTGFSAQQYGVLAVLLIGLGAAMSMVTRRRAPIAPVKGAAYTQSQLDRLHRQMGRRR